MASENRMHTAYPDDHHKQDLSFVMVRCDIADNDADTMIATIRCVVL
jgi:hypothetical protein